MKEKSTSDKLISLFKFKISKKQVAHILEVSHNTMMKNIITDDWKKYQITLINRWYLDINNMIEIHGNNVQSISIENEEAVAVIKVQAKKIIT